MLASAGYPDEALAEFRAARPLLAGAFGADSTQVRNLDKQIGRLAAELGRLARASERRTSVVGFASSSRSAVRRGEWEPAWATLQ